MKDIKFYDYLKFGFIITLLYIFLSIVGIGCPIKFLTGVSCAGCGMTRAWISLIHLDFERAFYYHPLFLFPLIYVFLLLFRHKISYKVFKFLLFGGIVIFTTIYIFRILNPDDIVVSINIKSGLIYKIYKMGDY
jgi:hypothetical protein